MATDTAVRPQRVAVFVLIGCGVLLGAAVLIYFLTRPPQMGTSERAFNTVDALYTAVRLRDAGKVSDCERRLHEYRDAGELPTDAAKSLDDIIATTRSGDWDGATGRLYEFMLAQRREGVIEHREEKPKPTTKKK